MLKTRLSASAYTAVVLIGFLILCVLSILLPHDPYIRWQSFQGTMFERTKYHYERLNFDSEPVDVVFIGSSRTAAGVDPVLLEGELSELGRPMRIVDLSLPASGMDIRLAQARQALESKQGIDLIVISVVEALPRDGHQAFGDLATAREVFGSPILVNRNLPANLVRLPMRQMKLAAASALPEAFGYRSAFDPRAYPGSTYDYSGGTDEFADYDYTSAEHAEALLAESNRRKREITRPILPEDLAFLEFGVSRTSIEEIIELAEANGARVAFMFLPFYEGYEKPVDIGWLEERGTVWIADWMRTTPQFYKDAAHSSPLVEEDLNEWIAGRIVDELHPEAPAAAADR